MTVEGDVLDANGDKICEIVELWRRDLIECVRELIGKPTLSGVRYAPEQVFLDEEGTEQRIDETWTAKMWWDMQGQLPEGATIIPIILGSDKMQLTVLSGNKSSWPVYLTVGNIPKSERRRP